MLSGVSMGKAAARGDLDALRLLLAAAPSLSVDARDEQGSTALHWAAVNGQTRAVEYLLDLGADPLAANRAGMTPLHAARAAGSQSCMRLLGQALHSAASLPRLHSASESSSREASMHMGEALHNGHVVALQEALQMGANPNMSFKAQFADFVSGLTPVCAAVLLGSAAQVRLLGEWGASPSVPLRLPEPHGAVTPLHLAAGLGRASCVTALLQPPLCADPHAVTPLGHTALHWAVLGGWASIVEHLAHFAPVLLATPCARGRLPLHSAAQANSARVCRLLIRLGSPWERDAEGRTPLHIAAEAADAPVLTALLRHPQANPGALSKGALVEMASHVAARRRRGDLVELLERHGSPQDTLDTAGQTAQQVMAGGPGSSSLSRKFGRASSVVVQQQVPSLVPSVQLSAVGYGEFRRAIVEGQDRLHSQVAAVVAPEAPTERLDDLEHYVRTSGLCLDGRGSRPDRKTALHVAAASGRLAVVLLLLHFGADTGTVDVDENTPVHDAAAAGHAEAVETLIRLGASPWSRNRHGENPLMLAVGFGRVGVVGVLAPHYLDEADHLNAADADGETLLHLVSGVVEEAQEAIAGVILQSQVLRVNMVNGAGLTPLLRAAKKKSWGLLRLLLQDMRIDVNSRDSDGCPLLVSCVDQEVEPPLDVIELLLGRPDLHLDSQDQTRGYTALHAAESRGRETHVALLLSAGCDRTIKSQDGFVAAELRPVAKKQFFRALGEKLKSRLSGPGEQTEPEPEPRPHSPLQKTVAAMERPQTLAEEAAPRMQSILEAFNATTPPTSTDSDPPKPVLELREVDASLPAPAPGLTKIAAAIARLHECDVTRAYCPPGVETLPKPVQTWRDDLKAMRKQQQGIGHVADAKSVASAMSRLDQDTAQVEGCVVRASFSPQELQSLIEQRHKSRLQAVELLQRATASGKALWELQAKELQVLIDCEADRREDDASVAGVDHVLERVAELQSNLWDERTRTNQLLNEIEQQVAKEYQAFENWRIVSEDLVRINRLIDMRRHLGALRSEMREQEVWLTTALAQEQNFRQTLSRTKEAEEVSRNLQEASRILQRRKLELEEAARYRDLLVREGTAAAETELRDAEARWKTSRERYLELKVDHDHLIQQANELGRAGFPEVWGGTSFVLRGGALLSLDSFSNVTWLRSPDVRLGERDGRKYVLKSRIVSDKAQKMKMEREIHVLRRLRHPLIMTLDTVFQQGDAYFLVMPFYEGGTLQNWLSQQPPPSRERVRSVFRGICQALTFLHSNDVVHADVKPENVLMSAQDQPILSDFDIARDASFLSATTQATLHAPGTLSYMAPELFEPGQKPSYASDVWSFGVCLFQAHFPEAQVYLAPKASNVQIPQDRDVVLRDLLERLLARDPTARPSADEALSAPYFRAAVPALDDLKENAATLDAFREMLRLVKTSASRAFSLRWKINPANLVPEALACFATLTGANQTKPIKISFEGERGYDSGGLTTSLYRRFFSEVFLPSANLFEAKGGSTFLPTAGADVQQCFHVGVAIARCLYDERIVELPLSSACLKFFFSVAIDFSDLEAYDEEQATQLKTLMRCPNVEELGLTFAYVGGSDEECVTDLNKEHFMQRKVQWDLIGSRKSQLEKLKAGFWSFAVLQKPLSLLQWRDLVVLLCGSSFLSADMLLGAMVFEDFPPENTTVGHFVSVVKGLAVDDLRRLLFFATESPAIPFGGLNNPRGHAPVDRITVRGDKKASLASLPLASVCFYTIAIPLYDTYERLKDKLLLAIRECGTSFDFR